MVQLDELLESSAEMEQMEDIAGPAAEVNEERLLEIELKDTSGATSEARKPDDSLDATESDEYVTCFGSPGCRSAKIKDAVSNIVARVGRVQVDSSPSQKSERDSFASRAALVFGALPSTTTSDWVVADKAKRKHKADEEGDQDDDEAWNRQQKRQRRGEQGPVTQPCDRRDSGAEMEEGKAVELMGHGKDGVREEEEGAEGGEEGEDDEEMMETGSRRREGHGRGRQSALSVNGLAVNGNRREEEENGGEEVEEEEEDDEEKKNCSWEGWRRVMDERGEEIDGPEGRTKDEAEAEELARIVGLDNTLDKEEEEDEFDRMAEGAIGGPVEGVVMMAGGGWAASWKGRVAADLSRTRQLPANLEELKRQRRDRRANHGDAQKRLEEDAANGEALEAAMSRFTNQEAPAALLEVKQGSTPPDVKQTSHVKASQSTAAGVEASSQQDGPCDQIPTSHTISAPPAPESTSSIEPTEDVNAEFTFIPYVRPIPPHTLQEQAPPLLNLGPHPSSVPVQLPPTASDTASKQREVIDSGVTSSNDAAASSERSGARASRPEQEGSAGELMTVERGEWEEMVAEIMEIGGPIDEIFSKESNGEEGEGTSVSHGSTLPAGGTVPDGENVDDKDLSAESASLPSGVVINPDTPARGVEPEQIVSVTSLPDAEGSERTTAPTAAASIAMLPTPAVATRAADDVSLSVAGAGTAAAGGQSAGEDLSRGGASSCQLSPAAAGVEAAQAVPSLLNPVAGEGSATLASDRLFSKWKGITGGGGVVKQGEEKGSKGKQVAAADEGKAVAALDRMDSTGDGSLSLRDMGGKAEEPEWEEEIVGPMRPFPRPLPKGIMKVKTAKESVTHAIVRLNAKSVRFSIPAGTAPGDKKEEEEEEVAPSRCWLGTALGVASAAVSATVPRLRRSLAQKGMGQRGNGRNLSRRPPSQPPPVLALGDSAVLSDKESGATASDELKTFDQQNDVMETDGGVSLVRGVVSEIAAVPTTESSSSSVLAGFADAVGKANPSTTSFSTLLAMQGTGAGTENVQVHPVKKRSGRGVPDYLRNPDKYTRYSLDWAGGEDDDAGQNIKAFLSAQEATGHARPSPSSNGTSLKEDSPSSAGPPPNKENKTNGRSIGEGDLGEGRQWREEEDVGGAGKGEINGQEGMEGIRRPVVFVPKRRGGGCHNFTPKRRVRVHEPPASELQTASVQVTPVSSQGLEEEAEDDGKADRGVREGKEVTEQKEEVGEEEGNEALGGGKRTRTGEEGGEKERDSSTEMKNLDPGSSNIVEGGDLALSLVSSEPAAGPLDGTLAIDGERVNRSMGKGPDDGEKDERVMMGEGVASNKQETGPADRGDVGSSGRRLNDVPVVVSVATAASAEVSEEDITMDEEEREGGDSSGQGGGEGEDGTLGINSISTGGMLKGAGRRGQRRYRTRLQQESEALEGEGEGTLVPEVH